jgi:nicotinamidase/pyrazinamidase
LARETLKTGIIVVDLQGDFTKLKNGSLAVEGTDEAYVRAVEEETKRLRESGFPVFATQDWHPANHASFFASHPGKKAFEMIPRHGKDQILWPPHCVQNTPGAEILLDKSLFKVVVKKGMDPAYDSYSGFRDDGGSETKMDSLLRKDGIRQVILYGIATDYCVRATALDAVIRGYGVILIKSLCRGVAPETSRGALDEMSGKGIILLENPSLPLDGICSN